MLGYTSVHFDKSIYFFIFSQLILPDFFIFAS